MRADFTHAVLLASSRKSSEDRAVVLERRDAIVVVAADGVGGMGGGAVAADRLVQDATAALAEDGFDAEDAFCWMNVLSAVDGRLAKTMAGETTGVIAVVSRVGLLGASVGDSQAWVIGDDERSIE